MTSGTFIWRSLRFHARSHLGPWLGAVIGSAVLIGALVVGDSVRESLRRMTAQRVGKVEYALSAGDRFFRDQLAGDMAPGFESPPAAGLLLPGVATTEDNSARANQVQVLGVDETFWRYAEQAPAKTKLGDDEIFLNAGLAHQLQAKPGDTVVLRVHKPSLLPGESLLAPKENVSATLKLKVAAIVTDAEFGRFSLQANQVPPANAFVSRTVLQQKLGLAGKANLLLTGTPKAYGASRSPEAVLRDYLTLADVGLEFRRLAETGRWEVRSHRVFLEAPVVEAALQAGGDTNQRMQALTYFVNELAAGTNATPYSMVTAITPPMFPRGMADDEMLVNRWLSDDLHAHPGTSVSLRYYVLDDALHLVERTNAFRVRMVAGMDGFYSDRTLLPDFPGIAEAEKTENWDAGFPIDLKKIRPKDEKYWQDFRGTPKAFISLAAGQKMWGNRFGALTTIRWGGEPYPHDLEREILRRLDPASVGLIFQPVRAQAAAGQPSQDFGELFLSFSFFLVAAALILMALLFQFGLEQRRTEAGTLLALGFRPGQVRRLFLAEAVGVSLLGGIIGAAGGVFYARGILHALATIWREAVGSATLDYYATPATLVTGVLASVVVCIITSLIVLRGQARQPVRALLAGEPPGRTVKPARAPWLALGAAVSALGLLGWAMTQPRETEASAGSFFGSGSLLLIAGLAGLGWWLRRREESPAEKLSLGELSWRGCARRWGRSVATVALLASGSFLVLAIGAFQLDANSHALEKNSGTGGFAFVGETALPVTHNLNAAAGRDFYGLDEKALAGVQFVPLRVRDGDEASCLNLNQARHPRLLGVKPELLAGRFAFAAVAKGLDETAPWNLLKVADTNANVIPAIGDAASIQWALHKKLGDTLDYTDETGRTFQIRLVGAVANSLLQGSLLIDDAAFVQRFPSGAGHRMFLVDAPSNQAKELASTLTRALRDVGLELVPAAERLAAFNAVQNTYLNTFQILGGLGLLLGSAGLGVVVLRNVLERRGELALWLALGYPPATVRRVVLWEHAALLLAGLGIGLGAAALAVLPAWLSPSATLPYGTLLGLLGGILACGLVSVAVATRLALRGELLPALRNE